MEIKLGGEAEVEGEWDIGKKGIGIEWDKTHS